MSNNSKKTAARCDVLIIGGGLVGASLACALADSRHRVTVIEQHELSSGAQPGYDDRTVALSYGSRIILDGIGLWPQLRDKVTAIKTIHISDRGHFGVTRLHHYEHGVEALGYVAENRVLGEVLYQAMHAHKNIQLLCPAQLESIEQTADTVTVGYRQHDKTKTLHAGVLIAADGVTSRVRDMLNIGTSRQNYRQSAVVTNVTPGRAHNNIAYERFTDSGPLALLPMSDNRCSVVWTVPGEQAQQLVLLDDAAFLKQLQQRFGFRLGALKRAGRRSVYPLALVEATQQVRGRIVVVGNAAHTLHPVAGQGFNLALRDIALLAELISNSEDAGDSTGLAEYVSSRQRDADRVYRFTDGLVKLFSNDIKLLAHARAAGLFMVDCLPPLKQALARQSMGLGGRLSRLNRGLSAGITDRG